MLTRDPAIWRVIGQVMSLNIAPPTYISWSDGEEDSCFEISWRTDNETFNVWFEYSPGEESGWAFSKKNATGANGSLSTISWDLLQKHFPRNEG